MINCYDVFLFDFDGTLFDTFDSSIYVFKEAFRLKGIIVDEKDVLEYTRVPIRNTYNKLIGSMDGYAEFIDSINKLVFSQKVVDMAEIYEDTARILTFLKEANKKVGIVTSNAKDHVIDVLKRFDLDDRFDVIVGNKEEPKSKPSPKPVLKALELLDYHDKEKVIYFGDSINDVFSALNAGVTGVLLDRLGDSKPTKSFKVIRSLDEIMG